MTLDESELTKIEACLLQLEEEFVVAMAVQ